MYVNDAYHSLSIEGYRVSPELIERVRSGTWNPDGNPQDRENRNALAARGYYDAFTRPLRTSVEKVLAGGERGQRRARRSRRLVPAAVWPERDGGHHQRRRSRRLPQRPGLYPPLHARAAAARGGARLHACAFELLAREPEPAVRVVLGHFVFVYIHPYMDGNGRMGRFLMNVMLASGGYPWTIIPVERRDDYMAALEAASVGQDIRPFAEFIGGLVAAGLRGAAAPPVPGARA